MEAYDSTKEPPAQAKSSPSKDTEEDKRSDQAKHSPSKESKEDKPSDKTKHSPSKETKEDQPDGTAIEPSSPTQEKSKPESEPQDEEEDASLEDMVAGMANVASGWLSGWKKSLYVAKDKSVEVYDMVKKDLSEFSEAVQAETSTMITETGSLISSTSQTLKETIQSAATSQIQDEESATGQVKKSVSGFLTHVHKAFTPDTMQDDDTEAYVMQDGQPVLLDRLQAELYRLAGDPQTYLSEPVPAELMRYEVWSADLDLESRQAELSDLLATNKALLEQYTELVPAQVSHVLFWHRYLFRVHLAEEKEKQREELRKRADQMMTPGQAEKQVAWEEDKGDKKDFSHHVAVTDAQADQLLADYDREIKEKSSGDERTHSPGHASSNDDDWVKADADADETNTNSSVGNDWEKWE